MAQFNSLLVTGDSRFINPINGNARNGVYYVKGTQTAATGSWTGVIPVPALYDGLTISYYLPYGGSGNATLNLTLSDGTTTGAVNCYYQGNSRLTTHYGAGSNIMLTYHPAGAVSVSGTATTDARWVAGQNYADGNTNTTYTLSTSGNNVVLTPSSGNANTITVPYASNAGKLGGASASESSVASTIVKRNSSGYVYAQYYNEANGAENPASYTSYAVFKDSSGWLRCSSLANFKSWFGAANYATLTNAGSTTGSTAKALTVPAAASEIIVTAQVSSKLLTACIPKAVLTTSNQEVWLTGGKNNATNANQGNLRCLCYLKLRSTTLTIQGLDVISENTNLLSSTTWKVFYR